MTLEVARMFDRAPVLTRLGVKVRLGLATHSAVDLDADEARLLYSLCGPMLREQIEHEEHPDERPPLCPEASLAFARQVCSGEAAPTVYFIQAENGSIKIGRAQNVRERLRTLQTASAQTLTLLASTQRYSEKQLHTYYRRERIRGEWFRPSPRLLGFIRSLAE